MGYSDGCGKTRACFVRVQPSFLDPAFFKLRRWGSDALIGRDCFDFDARCLLLVFRASCPWFEIGRYCWGTDTGEENVSILCIFRFQKS